MAMQKDGQIVNGGKDRPSEPKGWHRTNTKSSRWHWKANPQPVPSNHEVPMTFHHVIGWQRIWQMWNHLIIKNRWDVISEWAYLLQIDQEDVDAMQTVSLGDVDPVVEKVCWSAWNMVEGPNGSNRTDDPNLTRQDLDFFTFGGSSSARSRITELRALFSAMTVALKADANEDRAFDDLRKLFRSFRHLRNRDIVQFDESMWEMVTPGKYDRFGNAERHTTWRKATS